MNVEEAAELIMEGKVEGFAVEPAAAEPPPATSNAGDDEHDIGSDYGEIVTSDGKILVEAVVLGASAVAEDDEEIEEFLDSVKLKKHLPTFEECGYAFARDLVNAEPEVSVA